jgi:uncharacterized integral membrane protein
VLFWIVVIPLLFVSALFAIENREIVEISLWPISGKLALPLFLALIGALYFGFLLGGLIAWWSGRLARAKARREARRADALQRERDALRAQLDAARPKPPAIDLPAVPAPSTPARPAPVPAPVSAGWPQP